jgi:endonuclease G
VDEFYLERALLAAKPVCRIVLQTPSGSQRGFATGFLVSPSLLMTNWHVFETADDAQHAMAEFNYRLDIRGAPLPATRFALRPDLFYLSAAPPLDFALVAVAQAAQDGGQPLAGFGYHRLLAKPGKSGKGDWITVIQHPNGQPRQFAIRENELIKELPQHLWYASDTAPGSSGSPVFNDSFQIVALHHSGVARKAGGKYILRDKRKVSSLDNVPEDQVDWIANEGIRISAICRHLAAQAAGSRYVDELLNPAQGGDIMSKAFQEGLFGSTATSLGGSAAAGGDGITIPLRLHLNVSVSGHGAAAAQATAPAAAGGAAPGAQPSGFAVAGLEALKQPIVDHDFSSRTGYNKKFLGVSVPMPKAKKTADLAKMTNGKHEIPYEHFTAVVHKGRRMPLFTASNVDFRPEVRTPEPGKDYSRKGLTGLTDNDREQWLTDPRIPEMHQLPDRFYEKDGTAFDKGHVVRRDDVCFGTSYAQVQRANGDTFHTTNCTPQVLGFNRSNKGVDNWGDLENQIGKLGKTEKYCVFAGPILDSKDKEFTGFDVHGNVKIKVKIPHRFWKVVVARADKLQSFGFILEQDLAGVPLEFSVTAPWKKKMISLAELEKQAGKLFTFSAAVKKADQFNKTVGNEMMKIPELELTKFRPGRRK